MVPSLYYSHTIADTRKPLYSKAATLNVCLCFVGVYVHHIIVCKKNNIKQHACASNAFNKIPQKRPNHGRRLQMQYAVLALHQMRLLHRETGQIDHLVLVVLVQLVGGVRVVRVRRLLRAAGHLRVAREAAAPGRRQRALVGRLDGDDQVGAVRHHHVGDLCVRLDKHTYLKSPAPKRKCILKARSYLVQTLAGHLDAVHLQHLVVDGQQSGALGQAAGHQARDEHARLLLQAVRRHAHRRALAARRLGMVIV